MNFPSFNFNSIGTKLQSLTSTLTANGVAASALPNVFAQIGSVFNNNPNEQDELNICSQIIQMAGNPAVAAQLELKLATEQGLPPAAQAIVMRMLQPGADVTTLALQVEQIIRQGS